MNSHFSFDYFFNVPAAAAWAACDRGDWMLRKAATIGIDRRLVVQAAAACARLALPHVPKGESRPLKAIEAAEAWCRNEVGFEEVKAAAINAANAADAAANAAGDAAANATRAAAYAADTAANAAFAAFYAADAAAYAAAYVADAAARAATLKECAAIVRRLIPIEAVAVADSEYRLLGTI
jgi:hypothetical protein